MNTRSQGFLKNFSIFFKKTLKFPKVLPLPFLDAQETVHHRFSRWRKKYLKIFRKNPKVPQKTAVTGLDVAKKSRFAALFFDLKGMFLKLVSRKKPTPQGRSS